LANLAREMNLTWENQQQLVGDQASFDYIASYANRSNSRQAELMGVVSRTARTTQVDNPIMFLLMNDHSNRL
jgi:hypothetical protein